MCEVGHIMVILYLVEKLNGVFQFWFPFLMVLSIFQVFQFFCPWGTDNELQSRCAWRHWFEYKCFYFIWPEEVMLVVDSPSAYKSTTAIFESWSKSNRHNPQRFSAFSHQFAISDSVGHTWTFWFEMRATCILGLNWNQSSIKLHT